MPDLGKMLRKEVKSRIWPVLRQAGFDDFGPLAAWRHLEQQTDCVLFQTLPPRFGVPRHAGIGLDATEATFLLSVGTYYLGIHILPWFGEVPARPTNLHREITLARSYRTPEMQDTTFYVDPEGVNLTRVLDDALKAVVERGLPWLEETRDIGAYMSMKHPRTSPIAGPSDHLALDRPPGQPERIALMCKLGQWEEALTLQRRAADPDAAIREFEMTLRIGPEPGSRAARYLQPQDESATRSLVGGVRRRLMKQAPLEQERLRQLEEACRQHIA